jgi:hypothetical protein
MFSTQKIPLKRSMHFYDVLGLWNSYEVPMAKCGLKSKCSKVVNDDRC